MPQVVTLTEEVTHAPERTANAGTTPLEAYVDAAFDVCPTLGLAACLVGSRTSVRGERALPESPGNVATYRRTTTTVNLRPQFLTAAAP